MVEESCKFCYQLDFQRFPEKCIQNLLVSGFDLILTTGLRTITNAQDRYQSGMLDNEGDKAHHQL
jgi:hypothetical protein